MVRAIVMTGGTSGLGAVAAARIAADPTTGALFVGARGSAAPAGEALPLDLASLDAVRSFADAVTGRLGEAQIDALVLNAGTIRPDVEGRTVDGFETTFAVNHLAHHLLLRLLLPRLAAGARVVLTTSGTHDPSERAGLTPPSHADARLLAHPEHDDNRPSRAGAAGQRAYTASKLCNLLTVRALAALPGRGRGVVAIAYCPGQTPGTSLVRHLSGTRRAGWRVLGGPLRVLVPGMSSKHVAGRTLADLALGNVCPPDGRSYAVLRRGRLGWTEPSELARRDDVMHALWRDSTDLTDAVPVGRQSGGVPSPKGAPPSDSRP